MEERIESHQRDLMVKLTDEDKLRKGQELAQAANELDLCKQEKKSVVDSFKAKESEITSRIASVASALRLGSELRKVNCYGIVDVPNGRVLFYREDTGQMVGDRVLRTEERQSSIPGTTNTDPDVTFGSGNIRATCGHVTRMPDDGTIPKLCVACQILADKAKKDEEQPPQAPTDATGDPPEEKGEVIELHRETPQGLNVTAGCGHVTWIGPDETVPARCKACAIPGDPNYEDEPEGPEEEPTS